MRKVLPTLIPRMMALLLGIVLVPSVFAAGAASTYAADPGAIQGWIVSGTICATAVPPITPTAADSVRTCVPRGIRATVGLTGTTYLFPGIHPTAAAVQPSFTSHPNGIFFVELPAGWYTLTPWPVICASSVDRLCTFANKHVPAPFIVRVLPGRITRNIMIHYD